MSVLVSVFNSESDLGLLSTLLPGPLRPPSRTPFVPTPPLVLLACNTTYMQAAKAATEEVDAGAADDSAQVRAVFLVVRKF